jgi:uncharacterized protein YfaS (alpha-2-macroglobulin family)
VSFDPNTPAALAAGSSATGRPQVQIQDDRPSGALTVRFPDAKAARADAVVTALAAPETQALLARLEPLSDVTAENAVAPPLRPPSAAPPRPGFTQPIAFVVPTGKPVNDAPLASPPAPPPAPAPATQAKKPLVLAAPSISPVGNIPYHDAEVRIRFTEPMVPVATVGTAGKAPALITPLLAGSWRWIDSRVATFTTAARRLPAATEFTVTVPAGTRALSGATLTYDMRVTFATRTVGIVGGYPSGLVRPDSAIVIKLDQAVDAERILRLLRIETVKGRRLPWKTIDLDEARRRWKKNPSNEFDPARAGALLGEHHVIVAPATAWPAGTEIRAILAKGAPSSEGPRLSSDETHTSFDVVGPFAVRGISCSVMRRPRMTGATCPAGGWVDVVFSNPIDPRSFRSSKVQIEGEKPHDYKSQGTEVGMPTPEKVGRTYEVRIDDDLADHFGQPLVVGPRPSFITGPPSFEPHLQAEAGLHVLDPRFEIPQWVVDAGAVTSVRVQLFQVSPRDFFAFQDYEAGRRATSPGKVVANKTYPIGQRQGAHIRVDLRPGLSSSGTGHVVAIATAVPARRPRDGDFEHRQVAWIQVTRLGLSARLDGEKLSAWIHDITPPKLLAPVAGVTTSLLVEKRPGSEAGTSVPSAVSDPAGHVAFELPPPVKRPPRQRDVTALLVAACATDSTFMAVESFEKAIRQESALWYVSDDRFTYKPGEKVYVKGWIRWTHTGVNPDLGLPASGDSVSYMLSDSRGAKLGSGTAKLSDQGGFDLEVALPKNANLGHASFAFTVRDQHHAHPISIQEFRTPAFSVNLNDDVARAGAAPLILGESIEMSTSARYYAGGGLGGARIHWSAELKSASYAPPGWDRFEFAPPRPRSQQNRRRWSHPDSVTADQRGVLSAASTAGAVFGIAALPEHSPSLLDVHAVVTDFDRMSIQANSRSILVHPSALYVGLRLKPDTRDLLEVVVTDVDGNGVAGVPIEVVVEGVLGSERDEDDAKVLDTQGCKLASAVRPVACAFKRSDDNTAYSAIARVADARGRRNAAQIRVPWYAPRDGAPNLSVVPDKASYRAGEIARLDIRSAVLPATAVVTFARQGMIAQKRLELTKPSTIVELPVEPAFVKNLFVVVDRWGKRRELSKESAVPLPEHATAQVDLAVDVESARLAMKTWPTKPLVEPGENASFEVEVAHNDKPVAGAEVALMVVDEAVLALSARSHADPLEPFYRQVINGTSHRTTIEMVRDQGDVLAGRPGFVRYGLVVGEAYGVGGLGFLGTGSGGGGLGSRYARAPTVISRKDFRANAAFSPLLKTDARGRVSLTVKMPDSLTRYRVVALATAGIRNFGKAESAIVAQRKLNARTIAPRFLIQGDTFSLPILVQNLDSRPRTVDVAVRAANLIGRGPAGKRVEIPGGQRAEVRFDFATRGRGRAVVQTIVSSGAFADASNVEVPVYEPATTESFATYGTVDESPRFEQLVVPANVFRDVGGVEVQLASTQLQSLTDAYWYLYAYPYECAEQRSSRMLATAAIYDILDLYQTPGRPTRKEIDAQRATDVRLLTKEQRPDGGWGYFRGMKSDPFVTMQVLQAFGAQRVGGEASAKAALFVAKQAKATFATLEKRAALPPARRPDRDREEIPYQISLAATALTTLAGIGEDVRPRAERLHALALKLGAYPVDAKARLLSLVARQERHQAMRAKLLADLLTAARETASSATITTSYVESERLLLVSNNKTSALALDALIRERPEHPLVTKLARGVLDGRRHGRWSSTQENLVALQAIRRYFDAFEKVTPNYTGKLWFGAAAYAEQPFVGRSNARGSASLDWNALVPGSSHDLALAKSGAGRMYYRVGITYAPRDTNVAPLDAGFIVRRTYSALEDPADVTRLADGRWKIRLGAKVLVTLEAINTTMRYQVALVDPLPAAFETVNESLATAERAHKAAGDGYWDFTNLRDNRSEAFAMHMSEGRHQFSYTVRATTPGTFVAAPAKAEEMYSPETFGRSSGQIVVVE